MPTSSLDPADLLAQLHPDLGVERGQRLVEQQHLRLDRERAGQRHPLLLAAGDLVRVAVGVVAEADELEQLAGAPAALGRADAAQPQPELDVLPRGQVAGTGCTPGTPCPCRACSPARR